MRPGVGALFTAFKSSMALPSCSGWRIQQHAVLMEPAFTSKRLGHHYVNTVA